MPKTKGGLRNRTGRVHTRGERMNCGGLYFGNRGRGNQVGGGRGGRVIDGRAVALVLVELVVLVVLVSVVMVVVALMMA